MVDAATYILRTNATVQGLVGTKTPTDVSSYAKIFPVVAPSEEKAPYIIVRLSGKTPQGKNCDFEYSVDVISCATSYDSVTALNEAAVNALTGQAQGTVNGVSFGYLNIANEVDGAFEREGYVYTKTTTLTGMAD